LSLHYYTIGAAWQDKLTATGFGEDQWFAVLRDALKMDELLTRHSTVMDRYDPEQKIGLIVDEWGTWYQVEANTNPGFLFQQNSLRDALVTAIHLNIFNQHCDRVHMANIAQTINVLQAMILTEPAGTDGAGRLLLTPTYHVFEMYKEHQEATLLPLEIRCPEYSFAGASLPGVSGSASRNADGVVHVTLANLNPNQGVELALELRGLAGKTITGRVLTAATMDAHNSFDEPDRVRPEPFTGAMHSEAGIMLSLPAKSVVALAIA
jgi:alpha-N-arabinofuranosidase